MISRRLLALNVLLLASGIAFAASIVWTLLAPGPPLPGGAPPPTTSAGAAPDVDPAGQGPVPGAYGVIVSRNLFNPSRSDEPGSGAGASAPGAQNVKPHLFGVVLHEGVEIAYLQDPTTKRIAAYRVGDQLAGGTIEIIAADHVVLSRPWGKVDLLLHDPTKPRAAPPAPQAATPPPQPAAGGVPRPGVATPQPQVTPTPEGQPQPPTPLLPRPPRSFLRHLPRNPTIPGPPSESSR